jgi:CRISPR-associated exonuclease Cas4
MDLRRKFTMAYDEDDFLNIAGIQHFAFCRRQWALIYIEQRWNENLRTVSGNIFHEKAHNGTEREMRGNTMITRGLPVFSRTLGINGICDVVEFKKSRDGISLHGIDGSWLPIPVEYKNGKPKENDCDSLQLAAQAVCLEEMLLCRIEKGYLYYGETRHRHEVKFDDDLRERLKSITEEMHRYFEKRYTPKVKTGKFCNACSLKEICLPVLCRNVSAKKYIAGVINDAGESV